MLDMIENCGSTLMEEHYRRNALADQIAARNLALQRKEAILVALASERSVKNKAMNLLPPLLGKPCDIFVKNKSADVNSRTWSKEDLSPPLSMAHPSSNEKGQATYPDEKQLLSPVNQQLHDPPANPSKERPQTKSWNVADSFPSKLFNMLEEAEKAGHEHIVSFLPHGKAFIIHKPDLFVLEVLPKYFKTSRIASIQKQLSVYGFRRNRSGPDKGAFQREFFDRNNKEQLAKIQRKKQSVPFSEPINQKRARVAALIAFHMNGQKEF